LLTVFPACGWDENAGRSKGGKTVTGATRSFSREAVGVKSIFSFF
jgi:hypothetical protein